MTSQARRLPLVRSRWRLRRRRRRWRRHFVLPPPSPAHQPARVFVTYLPSSVVVAVAVVIVVGRRRRRSSPPLQSRSSPAACASKLSAPSPPPPQRSSVYCFGQRERERKRERALSASDKARAFDEPPLFRPPSRRPMQRARAHASMSVFCAGVRGAARRAHTSARASTSLQLLITRLIVVVIVAKGDKRCLRSLYIFLHARISSPMLKNVDDRFWPRSQFFFFFFILICARLVCRSA